MSDNGSSISDRPLVTPELYENMDFRQSLMERAERGGTLLRQVARDAIHHTAELATSSIAQQEADLGLKQERHKLYEMERGLAQRAQLQGEFDIDELGGAIDAIRDLRDPLEQTGRINQLRTQYARFRADPLLGRMIDAQLGMLAPVVEENKAVYLQERITANRAARTPEEAAMKFPGQLVRAIAFHGAPDQDGTTSHGMVYIADDRIDPQLETEAMSRLRIAVAKQDPKALAEAENDPAVSLALKRSPALTETYIRTLSRREGDDLEPNGGRGATLMAAVADENGGGLPTSVPTPAASTSPMRSYRGQPYGGTMTTPLGPGTVYQPAGARPPLEAYIGRGLAQAVTGDPHPELTDIAKRIGKGGRYVDPQEGPQSVIDPYRRKPDYERVEFKEPILQTVMDGVSYSVLGAVDKKQTAQEKEVGLDGVTPANEIFQGSPARNVRIASAVQGGIDTINSTVAGQIQADQNLARFAFFQNRKDGTWYVKDVSKGYPGENLKEGQAKHIIRQIYEGYGREVPQLGK